MNNLAKYSETGRARGIDQSVKPAPGSVFESYNIDTNKGTWKSRPGWVHRYKFINFDEGVYLHPSFGLHDYIADPLMPGSHYSCLVGFILDDAVESGGLNSGGTAGTVVVTPTSDMYASTCDATLRYLDPQDNSYKFTKAILVAHLDYPLRVYSQRANQGTYELLAAYDGGDTDVSYLLEPPRCSIIIEYKQRYFAMRCSDGGNRVYHTTSNSDGVFHASTWVSTYNFPVGDSSDITAAAVTGDVLYIFKSDAVYKLSGDGVDGVWNLQPISDKYGAIGKKCVQVVGHRIYFLSQQGLCVLSGDEVSLVFGDRLRHIWPKVKRDLANYKLTPVVCYDSDYNRLLIMVGLGRSCTRQTSEDTRYSSNELNTIVVYNIEMDSIDLWGGGGAIEGGDIEAEYGVHTCKYALGYLHASYVYEGKKNTVVMISPEGQQNVLSDRCHVDLWTRKLSDIYPWRCGVEWYILTHEYGISDTQHKLFRHVEVQTQRTGDWSLGFAGILVGDSHSDTITKKSGGIWNTTIKDTLLYVNGTSNFHLAAQGPVDAWIPRVFLKILSNRPVLDSANNRLITPSDNLYYTDKEPLVFTQPGAYTGKKEVSQLKPGTFVIGGASTTLGTAILASNIDRHTFRFHTNIPGYGMRVFLTNQTVAPMPGENDTDSKGLRLAKEPKAEIYGWDVFYVPRGVSRR